MQFEKKPLVGRKVLLIGIGFYDYEQAISDELKRQGAQVFLYDELPSWLRGGVLSSLIRRFKVNVSKSIIKHNKKILKDISNQQIDYVLVIKGEHINEWFIDALRKNNNEIRIIAYHWDSLVRYPNLINLQSNYDSVYTFDIADAEKFPKFKFRPLFYRAEITDNKSIKSKKNYDLCFVGWLHQDRLRQIHEIDQWAKMQSLTNFFYLYTGFFSKLKFNLQGRGKFVKSKTINFKAYVELLQNSNIVVDLPHSEQTGLTMRAIEAIGARKKLITTSKYIDKYEFYDCRNILIIDPNRISIDLSFINSPYIEIDDNIVQKYTIKSWVMDVFELDRKN